MGEKINLYETPYHWNIPYFYNYKYERPLRILEEDGLLGKDKIVLDVGCGDGRMSFLLSSKVKQVFGIDNQEAPVAMGKLLVAGAKNVELRVGDARKIDFPDGTFDLVVSFDVVEHLPEETMEKMLAEMKRVCKKGGCVAISTPNRGNIRSRIWGHRANPKHYKEYTVDEMAGSIEKTGLKIEKKYGTYLPIPIPGVEHYANVIPFKSLFKMLVDAAKNHPRLSETMFMVARKT